MNLTQNLERALDQAEQGTLQAATFYTDLSKSRPELFTFLFDEDTRLLLEPEHDYLLFLAMILLEVLEKSGGDLMAIDLNILEEVAEENWGYLEYTSIENLTETLAQDQAAELYEFLDEACTPAQSHEVLSETAVELVYVKCKSLIDAAFPAAL